MMMEVFLSEEKAKKQGYDIQKQLQFIHKKLLNIYYEEV